MQLIRHLTMVLALGGLMLPAAAQMTDEGQSEQPPRRRDADQPARQQQAEASKDAGDAILAGPEVIEDESEAAPRGDFANVFNNARRDQPEIVIPVERWFRIILQHDLGEEQRIEIERIGLDYRQAVLEYRDTHAEKLRELNRVRQAARRENRDVPTEVIRETRQIMSQMPKVEDAQSKIWETLTAEQQEALKEVLTEERERIAQQRAQRRRDAAMADEAMREGDAMTMEGDAAANSMTMSEKPGERAQGPNAMRRLRNAADSFRRDGLDAAGERRLRFLRKYQKERPAGAPPSDEEMDFDFDENETAEAASENGGD